MDHDQTTISRSKGPLRCPCIGVALIPLALLLLFPNPGFSAQFTLRRAIELASNRSETGIDVQERQDGYGNCIKAETPLLEQIAVGLTVNETGSGIQPNVGSVADTAVSLGRDATNLSQGGLASQDMRELRMMCTAIAYVELAMIYAQAQILDRQEMASTRLLKVEEERVRQKVDDPVAYTRAKLLGARTRFWAVELESEARRARRQLAYFTGMAEADIEPIPGSIPPLPSVGSSMGERRWAALRDVAQMEQAVSLNDRNKSLVRNVLTTATLGDMISAYVMDDEKLNVLLEINFALHKAQLQMLQTRGELQRWALNEPEAASSAPSIGTSTLLATSEVVGLGAPSVQSIMMVSGESVLKVGHSRQVYAVAIYNNGTSRDVSSEAAWTSSDDWDAITSSSGFVTAVGLSDIVITARFGGVSDSKRIRIIPDDPEPFNSTVEVWDCCYDRTPP